MNEIQELFVGLYTIFALGWFVVWGATGDPLALLVLEVSGLNVPP